MQSLFSSVYLERIEFVLNLTVDIFILALGLAALGFYNPYGAILLHHNVVCVKQPLMLNRIHIDDGEILLSGIAVFIHPLNIGATLAVLLKQHFRGAAHEAGGKAGGIFHIGIVQVFDLVLHTGVILEEVLLRDMECGFLRVEQQAHLFCHIGCDIKEFLFQSMLIVDDKGIEFCCFQREQLFVGAVALAEQTL